MAQWEDYTAHEHADDLNHGRLKILRELHSPELGNERDILVYLPPSYETSARRYPVIYMHDGQNLFDPRTSFAGEWDVDATLDQASQEGLEAIVVGIPNMGAERANEYSPFDDRRHGPGKGDGYLNFITDTIKPIIDADFRTEPAREQTGIAGSSMGGLISLYAFFKRSDAFGFAGVMSPALWFGKRGIFDYLDRATHVTGKIYLDVGTREGKEELNDVARLRDRLTTMGYKIGRDLLYVVDRGAGHNEAAWARRVGKQLRFLLGRPAALPK
jgi:predicted alpha/beta superfamily hydrolase